MSYLIMFGIVAIPFLPIMARELSPTRNPIVWAWRKVYTGSCWVGERTADVVLDPDFPLTPAETVASAVLAVVVWGLVFCLL